MTIILTRHSDMRRQRRYSDYGENEMIELARLARICGMKVPGKNGCKRYRFMGKDFVFDEKSKKAKLVTVI
jgi:hypothetical protein